MVDEGYLTRFQFQFTVNVTAALLELVSALLCEEEDEEIFTSTQLLWVNLIMDALASLALATDSPDKHVLDRKPESREAPLISWTSLKMVLIQATYQFTVTLFLWSAARRCKGEDSFGTLETLAFNAFIWMNLFNLLK